MKKIILTLGFLVMGTAPAFADNVQYTLRIDGISCPFCVATSEKALKEIEGVNDVKSDLKEGTITVCADAEKVAFTDEQLTELFKQKGFTYRGMETGNNAKHRKNCKTS